MPINPRDLATVLACEWADAVKDGDDLDAEEIKPRLLAALRAGNAVTERSAIYVRGTLIWTQDHAHTGEATLMTSRSDWE